MDTHAVRVISAVAKPLEPDVPGARYWSVSLDQVQLTYFEVDAGTVFPEHSHFSEQITHVVAGSLIFVAGDGEYCLGEGDTIAIPVGVTHAVRAGPEGARAFDAWSPPAVRYVAAGTPS
jgi:quercetin dioxygenase-like cupin family protein